jgi:hypothetical protein
LRQASVTLSLVKPLTPFLEGILSAAHIDLPSHLVSLVPMQWGVWRWFVLRGAGFPIAGIEHLAEPACAAAADALVSAEAAVEHQFHAAIQALNATLDRYTAAGITRDRQTFKTVVAARRRLAKRKIPRGGELDAEFGPLFRALEDLLATKEQLRAGFGNTFVSCIEHQSRTLQSFAADRLFQEAVIWQNRHAFETATQPMAALAHHQVRNQTLRQREELIANYLQRYCAKNDTIGFFGPVAWGRIDSGDHLLDVIPGPSLLKTRHAYFENWAIDKVAEAISLIKDMDWWIPPRLAPHLSIEGSRMSGPGRQTVNLDPVEAVVLPLCAGKYLPLEILASIQALPEFRDFTQDQIQDFLRAKAAQGILVWRFLVPVEVNAETNLRRQLLRIEDAGLRERAIGYLDQLERARKKVEDSAGNPPELNLALKELEELFESIAHTSTHRNPGRAYGGRTIVYEDCQRDLSVKITPELLAPAVPALALLLRGLRWLVHTMAVEFNRLFLETYGELVAKSGAADVSVMDWWLYTEPRLIDAPSLARIESEFKEKWAEGLPISSDQSRLYFIGHTLEERVRQLFPEIPGPRRPFPYYCPDMLFAATAEEIAKGKVLYVLGEIHLGKNTVTHACLAEQHPNREELQQALEWDFPSGCLKVINTNEDGITTVRPTQGVFHPMDYMLATTPGSVAPSGFDSHPFSDLVLRREGEELVVLSKTGPCRFPILEAFADIFSSFVVNKASWAPALRHVPRVQIDQLVIHRETWRARADELSFAAQKQPFDRFVGARRWMASRGITRRTFVKSPLETKPLYVDMESPVLVEILCRMVRKLKGSGRLESELVFSEMLPDIDQTWLRDAAGNLYTCELRFVIVDCAGGPGGLF